MGVGEGNPEAARGADDQVERRRLRAASQLVARTVLTRGITVVGTVALACLLTPADFGVFAVIIFTVTITGGVSAIGYLQFAWRNGQMISAVDEIVTRVGVPAQSRPHHDPARFSRSSGIAIQTAVLVAVGARGLAGRARPALTADDLYSLE